MASEFKELIVVGSNTDLVRIVTQLPKEERGAFVADFAAEIIKDSSMYEAREDPFEAARAFILCLTRDCGQEVDASWKATFEELSPPKH